MPFEDDLQSGRGGLAGDDWWRSAVIYQIYPRSFADSGGDGVGDLPGITGRLDYLVDLGVDAVWLSPFYASPMVDFGYDITDHCVVDPVFGTLADFDGLLAAAHARGLQVLVDFVPNHHIDQPGVHTVLRDLRAVLAGYGGDRLLLGEVGVANPARWAAYYGRDDELTLPLNFGFWSQPFTAAGFRSAVGTTEGVLPPGAWPIYALGNHDLPRLASRYDDGQHGQARARLAAMLLLTLRGTPLLYYGDEIGMTDVSIPPESTVDSNGRDPARTPMQWDATGGAGIHDRPALAADPGQRPHRQRRRRARRTRLTAEPVP